MSTEFKRGVLLGLALAGVLEPSKLKTAYATLFDKWRFTEAEADSTREQNELIASLGNYARRGS